MTKRIIMVCAECGSEDVSKDATVRWNVEKQDWELSAVYDKPNYCDACGGECSIDEEPEHIDESVRDSRLADISIIEGAYGSTILEPHSDAATAFLNASFTGFDNATLTQVLMIAGRAQERGLFVQDLRT